MMKSAVRALRISAFVLCISVLALPAPKKLTPQAALKGFPEYVQQVLQDWKVPGLAVSIVQDGKVVYAEGFGMRDVEKGLKVTPHTLFAIGSCTKAFTAAAAGILVDEGKLEWDKPVRAYLPAFKLSDPVATEQMTVRDLLCHRSGLPRHDLMWYASPLTRKELFDRLQYLEPSASFRAIWQYQNLMFMTAGYLVGERAGTTWENFIAERIFGPLGMKESNFSVADSPKSGDFALPYGEKDDKVEAIPFRNIDQIGPAGSINSNVLDMAQWVLLNLNKGKTGEKALISEGAMSEIHIPQMVVKQPLKYDEVLYPSYAMGWMVVPYRGHLLLNHGGGIDGFIADVAFLPRDGLGIVVLSNKNGTPAPGIVLNNIMDRMLGLDEVPWNKRLLDDRAKARADAEKAKKEAKDDRVSGTKPSHPLEDYAGSYEHPGYGTIQIVKDGETLKILYHGFNLPLSHYHYDIFEFNNEFLEVKQKTQFLTDLKGNISSLAVRLEPSVEEIVFMRSAEKKMSERSFLEQFVGQYELMGTVVTISLKGEDTLTALVPGQPEYELVPYKGTEFNLKNLPGYSVEFKLDASGKAVEAVFKQPDGAYAMKKK